MLRRRRLVLAGVLLALGVGGAEPALAQTGPALLGVALIDGHRSPRAARPRFVLC